MAITAKYWIYVTQVVGGGKILQLHVGSPSNNWGPTLNFNATDFHSTDEWEEEVKLVNSTGWWSFSIDPDHLDLYGENYFRINSPNENQQNTKLVTFASGNNANSSLRPYLEISGIPEGEDYYPYWHMTEDP